MTKKKNPLGWLTQIFDLFGELFDLVKAESEERLLDIKHKIKHYMIVYGLLVVAIMFILIGLVKWLPSITQLTEAASFVFTGCALIVIVAFYSVLKS